MMLSLLAFSCKEKSNDAHGDHNGGQGEKEALYQDVMRIHDEVMPKMNDIHRIKTSLKEELANNPDMPESEKQAKQTMIARLDSAGEGMMDWMRKFNPPTDSSEAVMKAYLENEMTRVKKVRKEILSVIEDAEKQ